ncbi:Ldh family oxidoreductase [Secundilactobacillus hailunensis]|uniref:Ldh family oxidoreductase n=1 Tax=Secundilactobacillus hailunensis TaxID=2559923 RepID=A0ABW1TA26_9LACO|nr:Ldh family oxidoreductase [Secundilactobacillus hailunensis]
MAKRYPVKALKNLVSQIFQQLQVTPADSELWANNLIDADLRGIRSHGVQRVSMYVRKLRAGDINVQQHAIIVKNGGAVTVINGQHGIGQKIATEAMQHAIDQAHRLGVGIVSVRRSNHFGAAGYYARLASQAGLIGISMTNTNPLTVPTGARNAFLGSNPIAVAVPADPHDFVFDGAMSTVSLGKFEILAKSNQKVPGTWALDENGQVTQEPKRLLDNMQQTRRRGGVLPVGGLGETDAGYKGFGLTLIVELLTSVLAQGPISADLGGKQFGISHFFMALDPAFFGDPVAIKTRVTALLARLRELPRLGLTGVRIAGDREWQTYQQNRVDGIVLEPATIQELSQIAVDLGVDSSLVFGRKGGLN